MLHAGPKHGTWAADDPVAPALAVDDPTEVVDINVQDVCPGRVVDHLSLGTTDRLVMEAARRRRPDVLRRRLGLFDRSRHVTEEPVIRDHAVARDGAAD